MRSIALSAAAFLLANVLTGRPAPASAQDDDWDDAVDSAEYEDDAPEPDDYDEALAPYGTWVDDARYGTVWRPVVTVGWQPYVHGRWVWTAYGWTWIAPDPWGWTFHYGRWTYLPIQGWVWVPGTVWGPAWVDWYYGDGYVGWAPLAPFATHVTVVDHFVFVQSPDFCARRLPVVGHRRVPGHVVRGWRRRDFRPPVPEEIERVSRHRVVRVAGRPRETVAPRRHGGGWGRGGHGEARVRDHDGPGANRPVAPRREPGHTGAVSAGRAPRPARGHGRGFETGGRERIVDPAPPVPHGSPGGVHVRRERPDGTGPRVERGPGGSMTGPARGHDGGRAFRREPAPSSRAEQGRTHGGEGTAVQAGERGGREGHGAHAGASRAPHGQLGLR